MKIEIIDSAVNDLTDGAQFYNNIESGLGSYFLDSLFSDIDSLMLYAGVHEKFYVDYFRLLSKRFPFAIYYKLSIDIIYVYAVLDTRKKPAWIRKKLKN